MLHAFDLFGLAYSLYHYLFYEKECLNEQLDKNAIVNSETMDKTFKTTVTY